MEFIVNVLPVLAIGLFVVLLALAFVLALLALLAFYFSLAVGTLVWATFFAVLLAAGWFRAERH